MCNCDTDVRHIWSVSYGPRRCGQQVKRYKTLSEIKTNEAEPGFDTKNGIDTRPYTICTCTKWRLFSASGQFCDVYGFQENFKGTKYVPIARVATEIRNEHGRVRILIVNQELYFGTSLDHLFINLNQIRNFGIPVSENPYDSGQDFGINHNNQLIPIKSEG